VGEGVGGVGGGGLFEVRGRRGTCGGCLFGRGFFGGGEGGGVGVGGGGVF